MTRIVFEGEVINIISSVLEVGNSDAQSIYEAYEIQAKKEVERYFSLLDPANLATKIILN